MSRQSDYLPLSPERSYMKTYQLKPGLIISLCIALLLSLRRSIIKDASLPDTLLIILYTLPFTFCCWIINQYIIQFRFSIAWLNAFIVKLIIALAACMLLAWINDLLFHNMMTTLYPEEMKDMRKFLSNGGRGIVITTLQFFIIYYVKALQESQQAKIEIEKLKQENLEARMNTLKQQISPHFLFNSLSTLKTIAPDAVTKEYVMQLANVYRYLLSYNENNLASLHNELTFTRSYLYILQQRFEDALQVDIDIPPTQLQEKIPPLSLQILVENAVKHNVVSLDEPLHIKIYTQGKDQLVVENNIQPKLSTEESLGKGLNNINDRYHLLAGKEIQIQQNETTFTVKIPLLT